jgi:L-aminopeptidase/D-esterase-like protein
VLASGKQPQPWVAVGEIVLWAAVIVFLVADSVSLHLLPLSQTASAVLAVCACIFALLYFFFCKLSAMVIRGVLRELKAANANAPGETLICLATEGDLERQLGNVAKEDIQNAAADALVQIITASLKEATATDELREVLTSTVLAALNDPQLKAGLKDVIVTGLKDKDVHAAAISGSVQGIAQSFTSGFSRASK